MSGAVDVLPEPHPHQSPPSESAVAAVPMPVPVAAPKNTTCTDKITPIVEVDNNAKNTTNNSNFSREEDYFGPIYFCPYLRCADVVTNRMRSDFSVRVIPLPPPVFPPPPPPCSAPPPPPPPPPCSVPPPPPPPCSIPPPPPPPPCSIPPPPPPPCSIPPPPPPPCSVPPPPPQTEPGRQNKDAKDGTNPENSPTSTTTKTDETTDAKEEPPKDRVQRRKEKKIMKKRMRQPRKELPLRNSPNFVFTTSSFKLIEPQQFNSQNLHQQFKGEPSQLNTENLQFPIIQPQYIPRLPPRFHIHVKPLIVLDLNGILCHRIRHNKPTSKLPSEHPNKLQTVFRPSIGHIAQTEIIPRSDLYYFLNFLNEHFNLAVWTSATRKTAFSLVELLFPPRVRNRLLFVWSRCFCDLVETATLENDCNTGSGGGGDDEKVLEDSGNEDVEVKSGGVQEKSTDDDDGKAGQEEDGAGPSESKRPKLEMAAESMPVAETAPIVNESSKLTGEMEENGTEQSEFSENSDSGGGNEREGEAKGEEKKDVTSESCEDPKTNVSKNSNGQNGTFFRRGNRSNNKSKSHEDHTAIKSLDKVWREFPLWNASNTFLLDDSPEKCPKQFRGNALHPPPICGTMTIPIEQSKEGGEKTDGEEDPGMRSEEIRDETSVKIDNDEKNQKTQFEFFSRLAKHWERPLPLREGNFGENNCVEETSRAPMPASLESFLKENACTYNMGWEMSTST